MERLAPKIALHMTPCRGTKSIPESNISTLRRDYARPKSPDVWLMLYVQTAKQLLWPQSTTVFMEKGHKIPSSAATLWSQKLSASGPPQKLCFLTNMRSQSVWLSEGLTHHVISHSAKQMQSELSSPKHHRFPLSFGRKCLTASVKTLFGSVSVYHLGVVTIFPLTTSFQFEQVAFYCLAV